ncbi:hypothetical protein OBBRIDRAFT_803207 [Obba rivulosa]|uniref:Uncharacterized protein n=1 Tax=Obba rivulosa TaxID=1052685 RepID=A0A8E2DNU9_9APHY|nr:hypothetical protein OBBRIDRAFT_803207 [Obba rivulosa]
MPKRVAGATDSSDSMRPRKRTSTTLALQSHESRRTSTKSRYTTTARGGRPKAAASDAPTGSSYPTKPQKASRTQTARGPKVADVEGHLVHQPSTSVSRTPPSPAIIRVPKGVPRHPRASFVAPESKIRTTVLTRAEWPVEDDRESDHQDSSVDGNPTYEEPASGSQDGGTGLHTRVAALTSANHTRREDPREEVDIGTRDVPEVPEPMAGLRRSSRTRTQTVRFVIGDEKMCVKNKRTNRKRK